MFSSGVIRSGITKSSIFGGPAAGGGDSYIDTVLGVQPANLIAFWPLNETSGVTADNAEGTAARDGTYSGVTLNQADGPFGEARAGLWDGINDNANVYTSSLASAFNGAEGSLSAWFKVSGAGVWTDGQNREIVHFGNNPASDYVRFFKIDINNRIALRREGGDVFSTVTITSYSPTKWVHLMATWSETADQVKFYIDGVQVGSTLTGVGTYSGTLSSNYANIGTLDTAAQPWSGYLMYCGIWNTALSSGDVTTLYNGGPV